jgi:hypothetical protein
VANLDPYIALDIKVDLTGNPKLVLTDPNNYPAGVANTLIGYFKITQPDGIAREGSFDSPDMQWDGAALPDFEFNLRRDANQEVQQGEYIIEYHAYATGYTPTTLTRTFTFSYDRVTQTLTRSFDVFTPRLRYLDDTNYDNVSGWTLSSGSPVTDTWDAVIGSVGSVSGSGATFDLAYSGNYYDAEYSITRVKELIYRSNDYEWLSVQDLWEEDIETTADTPPSVADLIECLNDLFDEYYASSCDAQTALLARYLLAASLHHNFVETLRLSVTGNAYDLLTAFLAETQCAHSVNRNQIISPYDLSGSGGSGDIMYNYFLASDVTEITLPTLAGKVLKSIDMDGVGRYFTVGLDSDTPATGQFIFVTSTGKLKYGGTMFTGQWLRIKYTTA